jgi:multiple sugar transport system permease protein
MAGFTIATIPIMVLFFLGQTQLIRGVAATGLKN